MLRTRQEDTKAINALIKEIRIKWENIKDIAPLEKVIIISEINEMLISTKESINEVIINWHNKIGDNTTMGLSGEILEKYKEVNKGFYAEVNKVKKARAGI